MKGSRDRSFLSAISPMPDAPESYPRFPSELSLPIFALSQKLLGHFPERILNVFIVQE